MNRILSDSIIIGSFSVGTTSTSFYIKTDGNIGVGTTNPGYKFDVQGSFNLESGPIYMRPVSMALWMQANSTNYIKVHRDNAGILDLAASAQAAMFISGTGETVAVNTSNAVISHNTAIRFNRTDTSVYAYWDSTNYRVKLGSLGISPTAPAASVHIVGSDNTSSNYGLKVESASASSLLSVRNDGNVGIGISSPSTKLEVKGQTRAYRNGTYSYYDTGYNSSFEGQYLTNSTSAAIVNVGVYGLAKPSGLQSHSDSFFMGVAGVAIYDGDTSFTTTGGGNGVGGRIVGVQGVAGHYTGGGGTAQGVIGVQSTLINTTTGFTQSNAIAFRACWNNSLPNNGWANNYYGFFMVDDYTNGLAPNVTNRWGIYIDDVQAHNVFMGTVSVGNTSKTYKLTVAGSASVDGFRLTTGASNGYVLTSDANGVGTWQSPSSGGPSGSGTTNYVTKWISSTQLGTSSIFDNGSGVGIGMTSPTASLHIKGTSSTSNFSLRVDNSSNSSLLYIRNDGYSTINGLDIGRGKQQTSTNIVLGVNALENSTALNNIAIGDLALRDTTIGENNTAIGHNALWKNTTGDDNTAVGTQVLKDNTIGFENVGIGAYSLWVNTTGFYNVAIGSQAMKANTTGSDNVAVGWYSLRAATSSVNNVAVGQRALEVTTGSYNVGVGYRAGANITTGQYNTAVGNDTMAELTTGSFNTFIGRDTGRNISTGSGNTIVGASVTGLSTSLANNVILADGTGNIRFHSNSSGNTGIGTSLPEYKLDVAGDINTSTQYRVGATAGWTGTFSSGRQTVTVIGGIITSVV